MTLAVSGALSPNKPNLDMILAVAEALSPNKPNLYMTLAIAEASTYAKTKQVMGVFQNPCFGVGRK